MQLTSFRPGALALAVVVSMLAFGAPRSVAADPPLITVTISGAGVHATEAYYPAYSPDVDRYAIRTTDDDQPVTVTPTASEIDAAITINGRPAPNGEPFEVTGLSAGDEINIQVTDSSGTSSQSWFVLPQGMPKIVGSGPHADLEPGVVMLGLSSFLSTDAYETAIDEWGVPVYASPLGGADLKASAATPGHFSVARGGLPADIIELDEQFRPVRTLRLVDRPGSTDFHDSVLLPDGGAVLIGYDAATRGGETWTDAIIERQDAAGNVTFSWNSKDHVDWTTEGLTPGVRHDYAHINSVQLLGNGDYVASFRNLSQVMRIAGSAHDGFASGEVMWRLGGIRNDFDIVDPLGGPCAQHAATILPNGHLMIFDNGSEADPGGPLGGQAADMCPDPANPTGPPVARPQSRVTEYSLDTTSTPPTATLEWSYAPTGRFAAFAGNAQRVGDNTIAGWSRSEDASGSYDQPTATEALPDGTEIWSARANGWFSYRAFKYDAPDHIAPELVVDSSVDGQVIDEGDSLTAPTFGCSDRGGSNLATCTSTSPAGESLPSTPGIHAFTVTATDSAGNTVAETQTYEVRASTPTPTESPSPTQTPAPGTPTPPVPSPTPPVPSPTVPPQVPKPAHPDLAVRKPGRGWKGAHTRRVMRQTVHYTATRPRRARVTVRLRNTGDQTSRFTLTGTRQLRGVRLRWFVGKKNVTRSVLRGRFRTAVMKPGEALRLRLVMDVRQVAPARRPSIRLRATNPDAPRRSEVVRVRLRLQP